MTSQPLHSRSNEKRDQTLPMKASNAHPGGPFSVSDYAQAGSSDFLASYHQGNVSEQRLAEVVFANDQSNILYNTLSYTNYPSESQSNFTRVMDNLAASLSRDMRMRLQDQSSPASVTGTPLVPVQVVKIT